MSAEPDGSPVANAVYLIGLVGFVLSALAYAAAVIVGVDLRPALAANAVAAGLLVAWAAHDTFRDPTSEVASVPGAAGTAMTLLAVYFLLAAVVVAASSPWHDRFDLAWLLGGAAVVAGVLAFLTFPLEVVWGPPEGGD